jgi:hypothetical protein
MMGANCAPVSVGDDGYNYTLFVDADLTEANLSRAWLGGAQLQGADFSGANLQGCNLQNAHYSAKTVWDPAFNPKIAGAVWKASDIIPMGPFTCIYYLLVVPLLGIAAYRYINEEAAVVAVLGGIFVLSWVVFGVAILINKIASKR